MTVFERECIQALTVKPISSDTLRTRREDIKAFIVKTLLFIGLYPRDRGFPILVTVLEKMSDSFEFDDIIKQRKAIFGAKSIDLRVFNSD